MPVCLDAADFGKLKLTDAIPSSASPFLGSNVIPASYVGCGPDPAAVDALGRGEGCR